MPSITLHPSALTGGDKHNLTTNSLPTILQTPSGLAILEIQGTIHAPFPQADDTSPVNHDAPPLLTQTPIGRLEFPLHDPRSDQSDVKWMKRVYLYVGKHQRLTGEVKKLPKPLVVISKRTGSTSRDRMLEDEADQMNEELEVLEIIKHKILFGGRPEPVGG